MGSGQSTEKEEEPVVPDVDEESVAASLIQKSWKKKATDFKWPENLYYELLDMSEAGSLVFYMSHLFHVARRSETGIKGLDLALPAAAESSDQPKKTKLTLAQIQAIVESNKEMLEKSEDFTVSPDDMIAAVTRISERTSSRKVAFVGLDVEKIKEKDSFFFLIKDDKLKRITLKLCNNGEFEKDWVGKLNHKMTKVPLKRALKAKISGDRITNVGLHGGFHSFLYGGEGETKYDTILNTLKVLMEAHPKHRLYVSGHGTSAAMAQIVAFFLTFDGDIPKPISCVTFGSPRVGDANFWRASQLLEIAGKLRICRATLATDTLPSYPSAKDYAHAGFRVQLSAEEPKAKYPSVKDDGENRFTRFAKKPKDFAEPKDYLDVLESSEKSLKEMDLNRLYEDIGVVNFSLSPMSGSISQQIPSIKSTNSTDTAEIDESRLADGISGEQEPEIEEESKEVSKEEEAPAEPEKTEDAPDASAEEPAKEETPATTEPEEAKKE